MMDQRDKLRLKIAYARAMGVPPDDYGDYYVAKLECAICGKVWTGIIHPGFDCERKFECVCCGQRRGWFAVGELQLKDK